MYKTLRYICLLVLASTILSAKALVKDPDDNRWIIESADDLRQIMSSPTMWSAAYSYKQIYDIDFEGADITPIGTYYYPFCGKYDGQGHCIKNARILWDELILTGKTYNGGIGIFGYVQGKKDGDVEIKNLIAKNITITRTQDTSLKSTETDIKLGIICGVFNQYTKVHNIDIIGCTIDDGNHDPNCKAVMAGGFAGDVAYSSTGYDPIDNENFEMYNIFSDVDINLENTTRYDTSDPQFLLGGILGRLRRAYSDRFIPKNTIFTGTLSAKTAMISPTIAQVRTDCTNQNKDAINSYAAELRFDPTETAIHFADLPADEYEALCSKRMYYNYSAYNATPGIEAVEAVSDVYPAVDTDPATKYVYKTRTFAPNKGKKFADTPNASDWAYTQGVNFGKYTNPVASDDDRTAMVQMLNDAVVETITDDFGNETPMYTWSWDDASQKFLLRSNDDQLKNLALHIEYNKTDDTYKAVLTHSLTHNPIPLAVNGTYEWYVAPSVVTDQWVLTPYTQATISPDLTMYYKVVWIDNATGKRIESEYRAPSARIYVYNRQSTIELNAAINGDGVVNLDTDVYVNDGDDENNNGLTPQTPVKTFARAFELLNDYGDETTNSIVVMGRFTDPDFLGQDFTTKGGGKYAKPTTITGTDNNEIFNGTYIIPMKYDSTTGKYNDKDMNMQAPLRFDNIDLMMPLNNGAIDLVSGMSLYWVCNYFDFTFDENVRLINFKNSDTNMGLPADITTLPRLTVVAGHQNRSDMLVYPSETYPDKTNYYTEARRSFLTFRSGTIGRIICAGRNTGSNTVSTVTGNHLKSSSVSLTVNIPNDIYLGPDDDTHTHSVYTQYGIKLMPNADGVSYHYDTAGFTHNIGLIAGGQTDGSVFADNELNIYKGYIARVISSNISYGRLIKDHLPFDSFFGRSIVNIYGASSIVGTKTENGVTKPVIASETTINEMFGGILGRVSDWNDSYTHELSPYFYGESQINLYGGYIGRYDGPDLTDLKKIVPNIYGAGSGGVAGIGNDTYHTCDPRIPYVKNNVLQYGDYDAITAEGCVVPDIIAHNGSKISLRNTKCSVNLYSGIVDGDIYGGGYGYSDQIKDQYYIHAPGYSEGLCRIGMLYGDAEINMPRVLGFTPAIVLGNVYGGSAGSDYFAKLWKKKNPAVDPANNPFLHVANVYGNCTVRIEDGTIGNVYSHTGGNVFAGSKGIDGYEDMATVYGNVELFIDGVYSDNANEACHAFGTNIYGNIYGGCDVAAIKKMPGVANSGNTRVTIDNGIIGNSVYGGSKGNEHTRAHIEGSTYVNINGGRFIDSPYINLTDATDGYRTFNIYGGGYYNCQIDGDAKLNITSSLLYYPKTIMPADENPNSWRAPGANEFQAAYMDITFRHFGIFGGGWGEKTTVRNTDVYVSIPPDRPGVTRPNGYTLTNFLANQSFFDISGGGYSGDVGHWENVAGVAVYDIEHPTLDDYQTYVGGECKVTIDGYTYARKVIGGGFYGSCLSTNTYVKCGSLRQVYGGSLLGYVHNNATLHFGNRIEDFIDGFDGSLEGVSQTVIDDAAEKARELNQYIYITENIYGGNDVKGIIGTKRWESSTGEQGTESTDGAPLFCTDVDESEHKGIVFNIYGGTFMGDVYGAGNGHYRGYYVPEWVRYDDGPDRMYRKIYTSLHDGDNLKTDAKGNTLTAKVYRSRPMVGSVNINLRGNSPTDSISILGNFFGGGRECNIGSYNTFLPMEDPRRLVKGGHLHVNIGGHVHINGNLYLGSEGSLYSQQQTLPADENINLSTFDGSTTSELDRLGQLAYTHWYLNPATKRYEPGFPAPGTVDGNFGMTGEHMLRGYMKNIEMEGDVELTFYRWLYKRDADGNYLYETDNEGNIAKVRKGWVTGELAQKYYDADHITIGSFFLGGTCGSMTNNKLMIFDYTDKKGYSEEEAPTLISQGHELEPWGTVYRICLPQGVTITDRVVMGSQDATVDYYPYTPDFKSYDDTKPTYTYEGGVVTHAGYSFDLIVYNDAPERRDAPERDVPADFYTNPAYEDIRNADTWKLYDGTVIHRMCYDNPFLRGDVVNGEDLHAKKYGLAITSPGTAYIGAREKRRISNNEMTVSKLTVNSKFAPIMLADPYNADAAQRLYGASIYGGCYNSGIVIGDVILNVGSDMLGNLAPGLEKGVLNSSASTDQMRDWLDVYSGLDHYVARVFGGGYGKATRIDGNTYVNLINNFRGANVFGGGMQGSVTGSTQVNYIGSEESIVFGAIYGGSLQGSIGTEGVTERATLLNLVSGNVHKAYGGSCMGELYGSTVVRLSDQITSELTHLDYNRWIDSDITSEGWSGARLIAGSVYGGNDITGAIHAPAAVPDPATGAISDFAKYSTTVHVYEQQSTASTSGTGNDGPGKDTPGAVNGYNGFPLIGSLYAGSNGNYGINDGSDTYQSGNVFIATGQGAEYLSTDLADVTVPNIDRARLMLEGGTMVNVFGGGNEATITESTEINIDYDDLNINARAGFREQETFDRLRYIFNFNAQVQIDEVLEPYVNPGDPGDTGRIFKHQILNLFGGNDNSDMAIQPTWVINQGFVGSLYSGGNAGRMTYYEAANGSEPEKGLTLTIDSDNIHIDNVYGGGRLGDIAPNVDTAPSASFYGATLNIKRGIIEHVYGGNDVSGYVNYGTNVNILGAISGDVYCAGNGNYLYKYDREAKLFDYSIASKLKVREEYEYENTDYHGERFFVLPALDNYGAGSATDAQVVMAINAYRPNVARTRLYISGTEDKPVWVKGNVYCGGNSSTVSHIGSAGDYDVQFEIGSHVVLNGVFMGSNGERLTDGNTMRNTEKINALDGEPLNLTADNNLTAAQIPATDADALDLSIYPKLLDLYMRAVEVTELPKFKFSDNLADAYIGDFCLGGNRGSMLTDKKITIELPEALTIYHRIIGGCMDANVRYNGTLHYGGLIKPLELAQPGQQETTKVSLKIRNKFRPLHINYPDLESAAKISISNYMVDTDGNSIMKKTTTGTGSSAATSYIVDPDYTGARYYEHQQCNIYGGCFNTGRTIGDIHIDLYSDMLDYDNPSTDLNTVIDKQAIINGINNHSWRTFTVIGGGYGVGTEVYGDIDICMLPTPGSGKHPSAATIFGGSQEGSVIGNTKVELRDGKILANLYGASEAARLYGSTQVIIGYPKYYKAVNEGIYTVKRTDYMSRAAIENKKTTDGFAVPKTIAYRAGDIVPGISSALFTGRVDKALPAGFEIGQELESSYCVPITEANFSNYFTEATITPADYGCKWSEIEIWVGDQSSILDNKAPYYGHGNVYGGGFIPHLSSQSLLGQPTVLRFDDRRYPTGRPDLAGYGGNACVLISDNPDNASAGTVADDGSSITGTTSDGSPIADHISIGTGRYNKVATKPGNDAMGLYVFNKTKNRFTQLTNGKMEPGKTYYMRVADGGVYGGGRKVFVDCFRMIDLAYYGYANHAPDYPKLINTLQRSDVVTVTDCCIELVGASDFTIEDFNNTLYSINRVGELRMISSLDTSADLVEGVANEDNDNVIEHNTVRSRNYIAFGQSVNHLAAFQSNWSLERKYHGSDGKTTITADASGYGYPDEGLESYINHKHRVIDAYDAARAEGEPTDDAEEAFKLRNVGTSANMIGITSGFSLRFEGLAFDKATDTHESMYFGPVYGVTEIKLLTATRGEGGGFVYALNHHYDGNIDNDDPTHETSDWCSKFRNANYGDQRFMMTSGNFVFPGAKFLSSTGDDYNYIIDDCYPMGHGFYEYKEDYDNGSEVNSRDASSQPFNVNNEQEVHYWYVNGQIYHYNVTVTGITSDDDERNFYLNNQDDLINLVNTRAGADIKVREVIWDTHDINAFAEGGSCDITDLDKTYNLYFTIDNETRSNLTESVHGAYVTHIPRSDYTLGDDNVGTWSELEAGRGTDTRTDPNPYAWSTDEHNGYGKEVVDGTATLVGNTPRLGIRITDCVKNRLADDPRGIAAGREYYNMHLKPPHRVRVVLESQNPSSGGTEEAVFTYIITLNINYLLGPMLSGKINIENCALPGEYIYANADDIVIDMDEDNLGVRRQFWKLYPTKDGQRIKDANEKEIFTLLDGDDYIVDNNEKLIHLPAYYYQNGWELTYGLSVGQNDFESALAADDPDREHTRIEVHNYHRMRPMYNGQMLDLKLVPGARVYIEDDADIQRLFEYLYSTQSATYTPEISPDGQIIDPQYAEGLNFYMNTSVVLPTADKVNLGTSPLIFKGNFHGNGNTMFINSGSKIDIDNRGYMYNTGFVSEEARSGTVIINYNAEGHIENCFYFNKNGMGSLAADGIIKNCYQNTPVAPSFSYDQLMQISTEGFRYGQVAYNLNGFYLSKRHDLLHNAYRDLPPTFGNPAPGVVNTVSNNAKVLRDADVALRKSPNYDSHKIEYIERMFNDGEYRYAYFNPFEHFEEALRTAESPNYLDGLNQRANNQPVSMHDSSHRRDELRWCDNHQTYHPIYEGDYLFFGEDLEIEFEDSEELPSHITSANRVYRVAGFYGSGSDKGYFFNKRAYLDTPKITAIDFVGFRDREIYNVDGTLKEDMRADIKHDGWLIRSDADGKRKQEVYFAPTIDLPWTDDGEFHNFESFDVNSDKVTHNLLIYTRYLPESAAYRLIDKYNYNVGGEVGMAEHNQDEILAHHIFDFADGPHVHGEYFHLVDGHDFNAPIPFKAQMAFMNRQPIDYADEYSEEYTDAQGNITKRYLYKTAWEGICLPFNVRKVYAASTDRDYMPDMGEITHFFDDELTGHEYWLRRLSKVDIDTNNDGTADDIRLLFERPTDENKGDATDLIGTYAYRNTALYDAYKDLGYNANNDRLYHFDDPAMQYRNIDGYRYLTGGVPYVVAYPGERYYEFDLSGIFFADKHMHISSPIPQLITYMAKETVDENYVTIPATDDILPVDYTIGGITVKGTYVHVTNDDVLAQQTLYNKCDNMAVLDAVIPSASTSTPDQQIHHGEVFHNAAEHTVVLPFRTYIELSAPSPAPMRIAAAAAASDVIVPDDDDPGNTGEPTPGIDVWTEGNQLVIRTPYDTETYIFNMQGQAVRHIRAYQGVNRYSGLPEGFYIVYRTKFRIP